MWEAKEQRGNAGSGQDGGSFIISGQMICNADVDITLTVNCRGGNGGRGQNGGDGGVGGDGANPSITVPADHYPNEKMDYSGSNGGEGGDGGKGGAGGSGGFIFNLTAAASPPSSHQFLLRLAADNVNPGNPGKGGNFAWGAAGGSKGVFTHTEWDGDVDFTYTDDGNDGAYGGPGQAGKDGLNSQTGCLFQGDSGPPDPTGINPILVKSLDALQLSMTMQRLVFEYQLLFCAQVPTIATYDISRFKESFNWLCSQMDLLLQSPSIDIARLNKMANDAHFPPDDIQDVVQKAYQWLNDNIILPWDNRSASRQQLMDSFKLFLAHTCQGRNLDIYGQKLNYINQPNLALSALTGSIDQLEQVETKRDLIIKQLQDDAAAKAVSSATAQIFQQIIDEYDTHRNDLEKTLKTQSSDIHEAKQRLSQQQERVKDALDQYWETMHAGYACQSLVKVLNVSISVLALAEPEIQTIQAMAAQFQAVGINFSIDSVLNFDTSTVMDPNTLQRSVQVLESDLNADSLKMQLGTLSSDIGDPSSPTNPIDSIIAVRDAFEQLVSQSLGELQDKVGATSEVKQAENAFNDMISSAQQLQLATTSCSDTLLKLDKLMKDKESADANIAELQKQNLDPALPLLDMAMAFYSGLYTFQKSKVIKFIFDVIRACNGLFLQKCTVADDFLQFGTFDDVAADDLRLGCTVKLSNDISKFLSLYNSNPIVDVGVRQAHFTNENRPDLFSSLSSNRKVTINITTNNVANYFEFDSNWFDVRLYDLQVYFIGATNKDAGTDTAKQIVDVDITIGDRFSVVDITGIEHVFTVPKYGTTFSYNYSGTKPVPVSSTSLPADSNFTIDPLLVMNTNLEKSYPMRTPFMVFEFGFQAYIDVSNVSGIELDFALKARNKGAGRTRS